MKMRTDYVTNSSSSSFVIAYNPCGDNGDLMKKIISYIIDYTYTAETEEGYLIQNEAMLNNYYEEELEFSHDKLYEELEECPEFKSEYDKALSYLKKGYHIIYKSVDYSDDIISNLIRTLRSDDFVVWVEN